MNTEEAVVQLNDVLIKEGISDEERQHRLTVFKICIAEGERLSAEINAKKAAMKKKRKMVPLSAALEASFIGMAIGWFAGILSLAYYQTSQ